MIRKILYLLVAVIIITGCASAPDSATQAPIGLKYFVGVWKLEESYLSDNIEYNYLVIKSDNTIESWTDRGLEQLYTMNPEWKELAYKTFSAAVSEWEGDEVSLDASLREKKLHLIFTAEDQTRQWVQVFDSVETLPEFNIDNDFENGNLKYISSYNFGDGAEWQIIDDPDDSNNSVLAPVLADTNSDADIQLSPGKNFTIEFDMKRKSEKISGMDSVSGLNFDIYRPMDITNDSSKVNNEEYIEFDFDPEMTQDIWYRIKVTVLEGRYFKFFRNEILFGEGEIDEAFITGFKIEGNPDNEIWYMDNLSILWDANSQDSYYTDFSKDDGDFIFNSYDSRTSEIVEIKDGMLHLRAKEYDGFEAGAQAQFYKEIPRNSTIYFTIKFGEYFNLQHPFGNFNFLLKNPDNRINFMTGSDWFGYFTSVRGNQADGIGMDYTFDRDQFYSFKYHLKEDSIDIYIDDELLSTVDYVDGLPDTGYFIFECHNEYWIDDFGFEIE